MLPPFHLVYASQSLEFIVEETFMKNIEHTSIDEFDEEETFIGDQMKACFRYNPYESGHH